MAYLDDTGLAYFWGKIKAWANSVFALVSHTHAASDVTAMTGYSMPQAASAISSGDTLNQAVGKLEKAIDAADISNVVHVTGAEAVTGVKTFRNDAGGSGDFSYLSIGHFDAAKGTAPSGTRYAALVFSDKNGSDNRLGRLENIVNSQGDVSMYLSVYKNDSSGSHSDFVLKYPNSGDPTTEFNRLIFYTTNNDGTTAICRNNTSGEIAIFGGDNSSTTNQGAKLVLRGGQSDSLAGAGAFTLYARNPTDGTNSLYGTAAGLLTWSGRLNVDSYINTHHIIILTHTSLIRRTIPSSYNTRSIVFDDSNGTNLGSIVFQVDTSGNFSIALNAYDFGKTSSDPAFAVGCSCGYNSTNYQFRPFSDNNVQLGGSSRRWKQLYAGTTTISTSDERYKQDINIISDDVLDAWGDVSFYQFRMRDAVIEKGGNARLHNGLVAQRIAEAFASKGLDASDYGLFCYDSWEHKDASIDEKGSVLEEELLAGDRYSLRYEEALCMEAAYQRRENARLKKRVADLEERLAALELRLGSE